MYSKKSENCPTSADTRGSQGLFDRKIYWGNIRLLHDTLLYATKHHIPGLLLMVDFEKAFESVAWSIIDNSLNVFNLDKTLKGGFRHFMQI